jgi:hypothetical protein
VELGTIAGIGSVFIMLFAAVVRVLGTDRGFKAISVVFTALLVLETIRGG